MLFRVPILVHKPSFLIRCQTALASVQQSIEKVLRAYCLIYILCLGLNSSGNSDMKVMWMKIPADNDWKQKIFPFRVGYNWEFFFCLVSKGRIFSEKYWYYFHCPKNVLCSILSFVFWIFPPSDTAVQLELADSKQNAIPKSLFQDL